MARESPDDVVLYGSDAEIETLIAHSPRLTPHEGIVLLSDRFLAKAYRPECLVDAMKTMETAQYLGIRTPKIIRPPIRYPNREFLVMERVQGRTLEDAWPGLSWYASLRLALQLRRFVSLMRSMTSDTAGSIATGYCGSFWLDDRFGLPARATVRYVMDFLAFWTDFRSIRHEYKKSSRDHAVLQGSSSDLRADTFVLTHHDLAPRNLMVDTSGDAWLIDWDLAGYYPIYFEYAAMSNFNMAKACWGYFGRLRWWIFAWLAAGRYEKQRKQLWAIRTRCLRFSAGRRLNIEAKVTQSRFKQASESSESSDSSA